MARPIIMTEDMKQDVIAECMAALNGIKMSDGKFSFTRNFHYPEKNVTVWLTPEAYKKTVALISEFSDEVGWHGTATRKGDNEFIIHDIFVYPQEVTASTATTDQKAYTEWLYRQEDEIFNSIRMQGHSHCNMGVTPSGVDNTHRQQILDQLGADMFYIFMIWNKSLAIHTLVYDMKNNILYEDKDVEVKQFGGDGMDEFLADAKSKVQKVSNRANFQKNKTGAKSHIDDQLALALEADFYGLDVGEGYGSYRQSRIFGLHNYGG